MYEGNNNFNFLIKVLILQYPFGSMKSVLKFENFQHEESKGNNMKSTSFSCPSKDFSSNYFMTTRLCTG